MMKKNNLISLDLLLLHPNSVKKDLKLRWIHNLVSREFTGQMCGHYMEDKASREAEERVMEVNSGTTGGVR